MENGSVPDLGSYLLVCDWLKCDLYSFIVDDDGNEVSINLPVTITRDMVLRGILEDDLLSTSDKASLTGLIRSTYKLLGQGEQ